MTSHERLEPAGKVTSALEGPDDVDKHGPTPAPDR